MNGKTDVALSFAHCKSRSRKLLAKSDVENHRFYHVDVEKVKDSIL